MVASDGPALHPDLAALEFLVGKWRGSGSGSYGGSQPFEYEEELVFAHAGKPVLTYSMRTWTYPEAIAAHSEHGFWRCSSGSDLDAVVAHATGHVEVAQGLVEAGSVRLRSTSISPWRGAKDVRSLVRAISLNGETLTDQLEMDALGQDLQDHVVAELRRV
jgi:hypothetical protein